MMIRFYRMVTTAHIESPMKPTQQITILTVSVILLALSPTTPAIAAETQPAGLPIHKGDSKAIKAFCIDFNWGDGGVAGFARPGLWADASPAEHVAWYSALGCNVIQTFAVSCNGYAWYKGGKVPPQPGLKYDFLPDVVATRPCEGDEGDGLFLRRCQCPLVAGTP